MLGGGTLTAVAPAAMAATTYPETFVDESTTWSYSEDGSDPSAGSEDRLTWTYDEFDDSAWKTANGPFGAKNGGPNLGAGFPVTTLLQHYIDGQARPTVPTYHFRTGFDITDEQIDGISALRGTMVFDDALQVFVNGKKVAGFLDDRVEAAPESERNQTYAGDGRGDPVTYTLLIDPEDLVAGENTLAVALYQDRDSSSDIYFHMPELSPVVLGTPAELSDIVMTVGSDETSRGITWYSNVDTAQEVQVGRATAGGELPTTAVSFPATGGLTTSGEFNRSAVITGLAESTDYVYRVGSETDGWSQTFPFSTGTFSGDYELLFVGDPQIGASRNVPNDQAGWVDTLDVAQAQFPEAEMIFSAGDQVESASSEEQYAAFLAPDQLRSIPLVPTNGNHDVGSKAYEQHFTLPNYDPTAGPATNAVSSGGNYWFTYKDVLYLNINSNNSDVANHEAWLRKTVAEQGDSASWVVLAYHHSIYSVANHVNATKIKDLRAALPPIISDLGIDLVLQGHDHSYTRSFLMKDGERASTTEVPGQAEVVAGENEVLYVTANSASGSKYYGITEPGAFYASVINQERVRNYSHIDVTDQAITVSTMRSEQYGADAPVNSIVDQVTLRKPDVEAPVLTVPADSTLELGADFDPMAGVTAVDAVDGDVTGAVVVTGTVDTSVVGTSTLTYTVSDAAGNEATATRVVRVVGAAPVPGEPAPEVPGTPEVPEVPGDPAPQVPGAPEVPGTPTPEVPGDQTPDAPAAPAPGTAPAAGGAAPAPVDTALLTDATRGSISAPQSAVAGQPITIMVGTAYAGQTVDVWMHSTPRLLGSAVVAADGTVQVTVPADLPAGTHRVVVLDAAGSIIGWQEIQVVAAAGLAADTTSTGGLASTGASGVTGAAVAVLLVVGGGLFLVARRRVPHQD